MSKIFILNLFKKLLCKVKLIGKKLNNKVNLKKIVDNATAEKSYKIVRILFSLQSLCQNKSYATVKKIGS